MSNDDIVFDEIKYREPVRARRPDRDPNLACLAYGLPGAKDLPIFIDRKAADKIERHALRDTSVELGGIVLGKECIDDQNGAPFVWITEALEAKHYESSEARFKYTHESWEEITRERDKLFPDLDIVGWYHTHPDFGIFLSGLDLYIHENFFNQPLQIAYVVDPIRQTRGFFQWRNGRMESEPIPGFYVVSDRRERIALSRFVNDLEGIPNADGGGGGLSPRLEAELIAMISRPVHSPQYVQSEFGRGSATQTLLGVLIGALAVGGVLWLNTLAGQIQNQTDRIDRLSVAINNTTDMQRLAFDSLTDRASKSGEEKPSATFLDSYNRSLKDRERLRVELENRLNVIDRLSSENTTVRKENERLKKAVDDAIAKEDKFKAANEILVEHEKLKAQVETQTKTIEAYKAVKSEIELDGAVSLARKYSTAWWTAAIGWLAAIAAGLGMAGIWIANNPAGEGYEPRQSGGTGPNPPSKPSGETHVIS